MKKIKVLSAFLIIILLINTIMPLISYATERNATISNEIIKTLEEGTTNYDVDTNDKVENGENTTEDSILQEDGKNELNKEETKQVENMQEEIIEKEITEEKTTEKEEKVEKQLKKIQSMSEVEFSASVEIQGYKINTYVVDGIYYLFLPRNVDISNLAIQYDYDLDIIETTSGIIDVVNKQIINDFSVIDEITVTARRQISISN